MKAKIFCVPNCDTSSILIDDKILVDALPKQQIDKKNISSILITRMYKEIQSGLKEFEGGHKINLYCPAEIAGDVKKIVVGASFLELNEIDFMKKINIDGRIVIPVRAENGPESVATYFIDNLSCIKDINYDFLYSPKSNDLRNMMKKMKLNIVDCKPHDGWDSLSDIHSFLTQKGLLNVMFVQHGAADNISELKDRVEPMMIVCDGEEFSICDEFMETLSETKTGLYLVQNHAKMIWQGNKDLIIKSKNFKFSAGKTFYLVGGNECFGLIRIDKISPIDLKDFEALRGRHRITDDERKEWWGGKQILYKYDFTPIKMFDVPKLAKVPIGTQTFIKNVEFVVGDSTMGMIKDIVNYDPKALRDNQLRDDFRIAMAWHATKSKGGSNPYSIEEIENLLQLILEELLRRGTKFHPDKMTEHSRGVYEKIMGRVVTSNNDSKKEFEMMRQAFGSPGGKSHLASKLIPMFPDHKTYVEPFAGGGAIFWIKEPSETEVLNDLDSDISFSYRFMRDITPEQIESLKGKNWKPSKSIFYELLKAEQPKDEIDRFYRFMYTNHHSYGTNRRSFAYKFEQNYNPCIRLEATKSRLKGVRVYNKDYKEIVEKFDSPDAFFYLDPPYPKEWPGPEGVNMWTEANIYEMTELLSKVKGKFMVSINNLGWIKDAFSKYGFKSYKVKNKRFFRSNMADKYELIITNYDPKVISHEEKLSSVPDFADQFTDMVIIKDAISIVGSSIEKKNFNDIDILIRIKEPTDFIKRAIETRIIKSTPESISERLHFIWGDSEGPHDDFIPLYDLALIRQPKKIVKMNESVLLGSFRPMKPGKRFYKVEDILKYMYKDGPEKYEIEKKYNGFRSVIHKKGNSVKITSDQGKDITFPFPTIVEQAIKLSDSDFVLDCELVPYDGAEPLGRADAARYIGAVKSHKEINDKNIKFYVFDVLYYDKDMTNIPWNERYAILNKLKFQDNIKEVAGVLVDSEAEAEKAINMFKGMNGSEGAVVKRYNGKYKINGESDDWIKFRNELELKVRILDKFGIKGANAFGYLIGTDIGSSEKLNKDYVIDNKYLRLGRTFNTSINAEKGQILTILVEEVWRHLYKDGTIRYSVHKPNVQEISDKQKTSSVDDLDSMVVSRGAEIKEFEADEPIIISTSPSSKIIEELKGYSGEIIDALDGNSCLAFIDGWDGPIQLMANEFILDNEGGDKVNREPIDFPTGMQSDFKRVMGSGEWKKFVFQWHYRGHEVSDNEKYKYEMNSLHTDSRYDVGNKLQGITILNPTTTDISQEDKIGINMENLRAVLKLPQPTNWLNVHGVSPVGAPGTTRKAPAVFVIIAKGKYKPVIVEDHRIVMEIDSDDGKIDKSSFDKAEEDGILINRNPGIQLRKLPKFISYHIAHIADKHIILVDGMSDLK